MCALGWPGCQQPTCSIGFGHPTEFISATALQSFLWQIEWKQSKVFSGSFSHRSDNLASKHWKPILSVSKMKLESPKEKESNGCEPLFFPSLLHLLYTKHDLQLVLLEEEKEKKNPPKKVHFQLLFQLLLQDRRVEWLRCNKVVKLHHRGWGWSRVTPYFGSCFWGEAPSSWDEIAKLATTTTRCLKITEKVSFNIASETSYVYILSRQKLIKNAKNGPFWQVFENLKLSVKQSYQTGQF